MRYELIESHGQWIVACDGLEIGRHAEQDLALEQVADRLRAFAPHQRAALAVRFEKCEAEAA